MQQRISSLVHELEQTERDRDRAERRAEGNSLSRYLLARLRGEEKPGCENDDAACDGAAGGNDEGASDEDSGR